MTTLIKTLSRSALALLIAATSVACVAQDIKISGAGATFPYPLYSKLFSEYNKLHPEVKINYQSIGSGGGIRQFGEGTVDFGATDGPMTDDQLRSSKVQPVMHIPMTLGAVVPAYNLPLADLHFSGETLAAIFLGKVTKWNDPMLVKDNPTVQLPTTAITVVHRSDGSGTTYVWADYLSKVSPEWKQKAGVGTSVTWPVGLGGKGNEGVAGTVKQIPGALGYIELIYAIQNKINFGSVKNGAGEYVKPSLEAVSTAAATAKIPADYRVSITHAPGKGVYPIASFTWLLVNPKMQDAAKKKALREFLIWSMGPGQEIGKKLDYAPLPASLIPRVLKDIDRLK